MDELTKRRVSAFCDEFPSGLTNEQIDAEFQELLGVLLETVCTACDASEGCDCDQ